MGMHDAESLEPTVGLGQDPPARMRRAMREAQALQLGPRCAERLRERAYLMDPQRLETRALARMAYDGHANRDDTTLAAWMATCIDNAIRDLIVEDEEEEARGLVHPEPLESPHAFMVHWFALEGGRARTAAVRFNGLPHRVRQSFHALAVEGLTIEQCLERGLGPVEKLKREARSALQALLLVDAARVDRRTR
jgi:hypothetical protein